MEAALNQLRMEGYPVNDEDVSRLSPLLYEHINMLGRYSFSVPESVAKGVLRPLRDSKGRDSGESLFLRKLFWASLPNKRQKSRDR